MAKVKIQVMVDPDLAKLLKDLSHETGEPLSPMLASLLVSLRPGLESTLAMARQVKLLNARTKADFQGRLEQLSEELKGKVAESLEEQKKVLEIIQ